MVRPEVARSARERPGDASACSPARSASASSPSSRSSWCGRSARWRSVHASAPTRSPSSPSPGGRSRAASLPIICPITLARVAAAFLIAMAIGVAAGLIMGRSAFANAVGEPWLILLLNTPALIVIVLAYIWIGLNEVAAILAVALNKIPNVTVTIREGTRALDASLMEMAQDLPVQPRKDAAPRHPAAAAALYRGHRPFRPGADLEDRAGRRAARPLERHRLPDPPLFSRSSTCARSSPTRWSSSP